MENIVDASHLETFPDDGWKSKETSGGKIDDEHVVVNFSKMVMKLWDGGDKDPCDNQIFLLVCISETNLSPKCKSGISDF